MKGKKKFIVVITLVAVLISFVSMGNVNAISEPKGVIGYLNVDMRAVSQNIYYHRTERLLEEAGYQILASFAYNNDEVMIAGLETMIESKVDAIIQATCRLDVMKPYLKKAIDAGIPVFLLDAGCMEGVISAVTGNCFDYGAITAKYLADFIGGKGEIVIFHHDTHPWSIERSIVARAVFSTYPDIEIVYDSHVEAVRAAEWGMSTTENLLTSYPNLKAIWCTWDMPGIGAAQAIEDMRKKNQVFVIGIDADPSAVKSVREGGPFIATVRQDFEGMVDITVRRLLAYLERGEKPGATLIVLPGIMYTKENVPVAGTSPSEDYKGEATY